MVPQHFKMLKNGDILHRTRCFFLNLAPRRACATQGGRFFLCSQSSYCSLRLQEHKKNRPPCVTPLRPHSLVQEHGSLASKFSQLKTRPV
jgi:hypothetical protein